MAADHSGRPSVLRRVRLQAEKSIPEPTADTARRVVNFWRDAPRMAAIGIFVLLLGAFLYAARTLIAPIVAAACVSITFGPLAVRAAHYRVPPVLVALGCVGLVILVANVGMILLAGVLAELAGESPEFATTLREKAVFLERPLATWRELQMSLARCWGLRSSR